MVLAREAPARPWDGPASRRAARGQGVRGRSPAAERPGVPVGSSYLRGAMQALYFPELAAAEVLCLRAFIVMCVLRSHAIE